MVFLKEFFEKVDFDKISKQKSVQNNPVGKELYELTQFLFLFVWFDSLRPINNLSVIKGQVFLGWTSTKLGLMFLLSRQRVIWINSVG